MAVDALVVGSGVAGLSVAVRLADAGIKVGVVTKAALEETTRERVPLDWATTQNNLGNSL